MPAVMASPRMNSAPPKLRVALDELVVDRMMSGSSRLRSMRILFLVSTTRSARSRAAQHGPEARGLRRSSGAVVLVTDLAPGQSDEHVFQGHLAAGRGPDEGIVPVLVDEVVRGCRSPAPVRGR